MAASSSSSSSNTSRTFPSSKYDVFLSFRGADTRLNFTDYLYTALVDAGIETFRDDNDLPRGENIDQQLLTAIHDSKCSVIVFSKGYASSESCLYELVTILEYKKTSNHIVIPVFYDIDPSEVSNQTGSFMEAFSEHEEQFKEDINKVNRWREALKEAADLAGLNLQNKHQAEFVKEIVNQVEIKLKPCDVTRYLYGRDSDLDILNLKVRNGSSDAKILFICGIAGIGKTTIAKCIFNSNFRRFERIAFLENASVSSRLYPDGDMINKLVSSLTKRDVKIPGVDSHEFAVGIELLVATISSKKVLIVFDGVEEDDKVTLGLIISINSRICPGSKIIITTRRHRESLTRSLKAKRLDLSLTFMLGEFKYEIFEVKKLDLRNSLALFLWHAFIGKESKDLPEKGPLLDMVIMVAEHCEGNPLALKMAAGSLDWTSTVVREEVIELLKLIPQFSKQKSISEGYRELGKKVAKKLFQDFLDLFE